MNVVITGASRGIGYSTAKAFCGEGVDNLYLISRNAGALDELKNECTLVNKSVKVHPIPFDLKHILSGDNNILELISVPTVDILINNAGMLINKSFQEVTIDEAKELFDVNFHSSARLIAMLLSKMGRENPSHVVNISSMGGFQGSSKFPGLSYYSASKGALAVLTECLAVEYAGQNIFFNALALGAVQTEMLADAFPGYKAPLNSDEMARFIVDFAMNGSKYFNGKILPVTASNP